MLKYKNSPNGIVTYGYTADTLSLVLRIPTPLAIKFFSNSNDEEPFKTFTVESNVDGKVEYSEDGDRKQRGGYSNVLEVIAPYFNTYRMVVEFLDAKKFREIFPLWYILGKIKSNLAGAFKSMNYEDGMFVFRMNTRSPKDLNEIYFWEKDSSMFAFDGKSTRFIFDKHLIEPSGEVKPTKIDDVLDIIGK